MGRELIVDYHMHLRDERNDIDHTADAAEKFVLRARERGIDEIGFTEHVYYFHQTRECWSRPYQLERCHYDLDVYVDAVLEAQRRGLPVKLGLDEGIMEGPISDGGGPDAQPGDEGGASGTREATTAGAAMAGVMGPGGAITDGGAFAEDGATDAGGAIGAIDPGGATGFGAKGSAVTGAGAGELEMEGLAVMP